MNEETHRVLAVDKQGASKYLKKNFTKEEAEMVARELRKRYKFLGDQYTVQPVPDIAAAVLQELQFCIDNHPEETPADHLDDILHEVRRQVMATIPEPDELIQQDADAIRLS